jgi:coenzyme F420 hydrogenase subunit beta
MRSACNACSDFSNIYADISFGGLGSQDKYTTVITRTTKGKYIFQKVLDAGIVKCLDMDSNKKSKMIEKIGQFSRSKVKRREEFMKNLN